MIYGSDLISKLLYFTFLSNNHLHWNLQLVPKDTVLVLHAHLTPQNVVGHPQTNLICRHIGKKKPNVYYV